MNLPRLFRLAGCAAGVAISTLAVATAADGAPAFVSAILEEHDLAYGAHPRQTLDVYWPGAGAGAGRPVLLMVHGGAWRFGDKRAGAVCANKVGYWVPRGWVFVSVNYRLAAVTPLEQAQDVARALAFVQREAGRWGADPARVVLMGHSAGAHLVALLAAAPELATAEGAAGWRGTVCLDSGAYDVVEIMTRSHARFYDRAFGRDPALWQAASPLRRLRGAPGPLLLVCSTRREQSLRMGRDFATQVRAAGGRVELLAEPLSHRAINEALGSDNDYTRKVDAFLASLW